MSDNLTTYLHDHFAGSRFAIELLESLGKQYSKEPLGIFANALAIDVKQDQEVLQKIIDSVGKASLDLKDAAGWFAEKASRLKLGRDESGGGIGTFEALETLSLGIRGKLALWGVLPLIRKVDARIPEIDFAALAARAEEQYERVENQRLQLAPITFANR
jgi:hypothetical protein